MKEYFHIDLSNKFQKKGTTGIACLRLPSKIHNGCALSYRVKKYIQNKLFIEKNRKEYAKLYAICIYYLIKDNFDNIDKLVICNDEEFEFVRNYLEKLLAINNKNIKIISIDGFRKELSRKVQSPTDNYARHYAKRGLKPNKWNKGIKLLVVSITYLMIKEMWMKIK